jgi:hypothetical protein
MLSADASRLVTPSEAAQIAIDLLERNQPVGCQLLVILDHAAGGQSEWLRRRRRSALVCTTHRQRLAAIFHLRQYVEG